MRRLACHMSAPTPKHGIAAGRDRTAGCTGTKAFARCCRDHAPVGARLLRVARTLADLDGTEKIGQLHLAEALSYRALAEDVRHAA
jgi:Magnesium chelatase, subunit ChlI C-terminal